jgi:hypothetical protein
LNEEEFPTRTISPDRISISSSETPLIIRSQSVQSTPSSTEKKVDTHEVLKQKFNILQNIIKNLTTDQRNSLRAMLERRIN